MTETKVCMYCGVGMKPVIGSQNEIYGADEPSGYTKVTTGDFYCPKCRGGNCGVSIPLTTKDIENLHRWFQHNPEDLQKCIPEIQEAFKKGEDNHD